ncbi:MAG: nuclear transport factor 2 family protein [Parvibaculaceae bacterium]
MTTRTNPRNTSELSHKPISLTSFACDAFNARGLMIKTIALFMALIPVSVMAQKTDEQQIVSIIAAIESGWEEADGKPFRTHFLNSYTARYIEGGGQNVGLDDLVDHHVVPEGDALSSLELNFTNIETHVEDDFAWAIADVEVIATIRADGRRIHNKGYETFVFKKIDQDWKVLHTHSSSRPAKSDESHDHGSDHH